jgi:3-hydroxyisobutyrate dehydrogenase
MLTVPLIAFIGIGRMGLPMCANLVAAGYQVTAADARPQAQADAVRCGARWRDDPAEAAAGADLVITMLPGPPEVREVMAGPGGILAAMPAAATWIDMSSSSPATGRALAAVAHARGIGVLDAPVGGGVKAAQAGTLQLFAGGDAAVLERCRPVLEVLAGPGRIIHAGGNGAGYTTKLLVNLLWFGQAVATAEALLIGGRSGIDLSVLRQALAGSAASTVFIDHDLDALLGGDYLTSFGLDRCCEELEAVTALARELAVPCELTQQVEHTYQEALKRYGPADGELLAVALLEEQAGLELRRPAAADPG